MDAPAVSPSTVRAAVLHAPALPRRPEPNPASGRNTHRWDGVLRSRMLLGLSTACIQPRRGQRALCRHISATDRTGRPSPEAGLRVATSSPSVPDQRTHWSFKQFRPGVLMLNIAAAGVAPACRTKRGTPDRQPADAASLRSPNAARLKRRIPTGKLVPRQACPKYARVVQNRAGSNLQAVDTTTGGNRWRDSKSADRKVMGVRPPPPGTTLRYSKHII